MARAATIVTPAGRAKYPHLTSPDTKFAKDEFGFYHTKLSIPTSLAEQSLIPQLDAAFAQAQVDMLAEQQKEAQSKGKKPPTKLKEADLPYKQDPDNEDNTLFTFKMKAGGKSTSGETYTRRPAIYDAKNNPLPPNTKIGGGSLLRVSFEIVPFFTALVGAGISNRLHAVKVLELKEFGERTGESYGFEEEDGYEAEAAGEEPAANEPGENTNAKGSDF